MQPDDELNDAAVDRELRRVLAVDPSPEFLARVRMRVADEPTRSAWRASWIFALSAVGAAIVAAIVIQIANRGGALAPGTAPLSARTIGSGAATLPSSTASSYIESVASASARPEPVDQPPRFALRRSAVASAKAEGRVLIDPRESAALRALISGVRSGRLDLSPVLRASTPAAMDLPPIEEIDIPVITIEPLAPIGAEGVRQ